MTERQLVLSKHAEHHATIDGDIYVWKVILSNHEQSDDVPWEIHVLACNIISAAFVAKDLADTLADGDYKIISSIALVGMYGLYAAPDVMLIPTSEYKEWRANANQ